MTQLPLLVIIQPSTLRLSMNMSFATSDVMTMPKQEDEHYSELVAIESRRVVRKFSNQLTGHGTLEETLREDVERSERRKMFESPPKTDE